REQRWQRAVRRPVAPDACPRCALVAAFRDLHRSRTARAARGRDHDHGAVARSDRLIARRSLLILALVAGFVAGALYYIGAQRVSMIVAAQDVAAIRPLTAEDLEVRSVPADALPAGAISSVDEAIGRVPIA